MKVALPWSGGSLGSHFGQAEEFWLGDVDPENGTIRERRFIKAPPHEHGLLPRFLAENGAEVVLAGGMGQHAQDLLREKGIRVVVGVRAMTGSPEDIVRSYLAGRLPTGENMCDH